MRYSVPILSALVGFSLLMSTFPAHASSLGQVVAQGEENESGSGKLMEAFGEQHPAIVHFPIALMLAAALAEILALASGRQLFVHAARYCVIIGALGALAAVPTGWAVAAEDFGGVTDEGLAQLVSTHRWFGTATLALFAATAILSELARRKNSRRLLIVYRIALFVGAASVAATGYLGGKIVYG
jgi:uncharacterized membrane protein